MDQIKIGKFIQEKRKEKNLTQSELAEKLNISDRAISKWENGVCMPDVGNMPELCNILSISINDLISGEKVDMKNNEKKLEENLLEMTKLKEEKDKLLLNLEIVIGIILVLFYLAICTIVAYIDMKESLRVTILVVTLVIFLIGMFYLLKIEQKAGYYECKKCHHKYVPSYNKVLWAMHYGRTRYMKCPECKKWSWQKKVVK